MNTSRLTQIEQKIDVLEQKLSTREVQLMDYIILKDNTTLKNWQAIAYDLGLDLSQVECARIKKLIALLLEAQELYALK